MRTLTAPSRTTTFIAPIDTDIVGGTNKQALGPTVRFENQNTCRHSLPARIHDGLVQRYAARTVRQTPGNAAAFAVILLGSL